MALHALQFGNVRAVAMLWQRVVRELRFAHWDRGVPLPRMCTGGFSGGSGGKSKSESKGTGAVDGAKAKAEEEAEGEGGEEEEEEETPDIIACLLHQKLQLLNVCINRRKAASVAAFKAGAVQLESS